MCLGYGVCNFSHGLVRKMHMLLVLCALHCAPLGHSHGLLLDILK